LVLAGLVLVIVGLLAGLVMGGVMQTLAPNLPYSTSPGQYNAPLRGNPGSFGPPAGFRNGPSDAFPSSPMFRGRSRSTPGFPGGP